MTKTELIESIRAIVRSEIRSQLPGLIVEILASDSPSTKLVSERVERAPTPAQQPRTPLLTVRDPKLQAALNSTRGGVPSETTMPVAGMAVIPRELLSENKGLAAVDAAMKKDYRGLLKAVDKSKGKSTMNFQMSPPTSFEQDPS